MLALYVFLALFLVLLATLAWGAFRVFSTRDDKGKSTPVGCAGGLAALALIAVIGVLGLCVLWLGALASSIAEVVEHNPVERVGVWIDPETEVARDPDLPLHVLIEASEGFELPSRLIDDLKRDTGGEARVTLETIEREDGTRAVRIDIALPVSDRDLDEMMQELVARVGGAAGAGIEVRLVGAHTKW